MKIFLSFMAVCFIALSSFSQNNSVTLKVNGNKNKKVVVDGKTYTMSNTNPKANNKNITITGLQAGLHTIQVYRTTKAASLAQKTFTLREGYDMIITINGSGALLLKEKRNSKGTGTVVTAMTPQRFEQLVENVQDQWQAGAKLNAIQSAFANTSNHFTTAQARQLIQMIDAEAGRLQLAKASYRSIIDPVNFSNMYPLLTEEASRNELSAYVKNYHSGTTTGAPVAMNAAKFSDLLKSIQDQWQTGGKLTLITNTFANTANYFTAAQARQLVQQVDAEASRLQLAKASYRSITDPANFNSIYSLLDNESSRNELLAYVNRYNNTTTTTAFDKLMQGIQNQWQVSAKFNIIMDAFNGGNYFTSSQARQMIQTVDAESSRLQLAKASYKTITDVANFNLVSELIDGQTGRNDLAAYIRNGGEVLVPAEPTTTKAMSDADFQAILNELNAQWIPGSKMQVLQGIFDNSANYFSTPQVRQLVMFVSLEGNRLLLLKSAYRNTTDKANFSNLYDLLPTKASRDALAAYVRG